MITFFDQSPLKPLPAGKRGVTRRSGSVAAALHLLVRVIIGSAFIVFGLNEFWHFMKHPDLGGAAAQVATTMNTTGYIRVIAWLQIVGGIFIISGRLVNLGIFLLGPVVVNILLVHICLQREGLGLAITIALGVLYLAWRNRGPWLSTLFGQGQR